ncbi:MAG TPA: universal stress protein, partial [Methylomirabilota bacterium]|nr:universal stress protein [Methylomirabilota bacterium]
MKKLLLAYDGSPGADAAMSDLAWAGLPPEMEALVFSVADVWLPSNPESPGEVALPGATPAAILKARQEALQAVQSCLALARNAAERLRTLHPGWKVEAGSTGDSPAWAVIRRADEWRADLVVAGSHGRSALERLFLGSVSQKIAAEAHCSVRIVRSGRVPRPGRLRIMVAVDGSRDAEAALTEVASRIWPDFSEFRVVAVLDARL